MNELDTTFVLEIAEEDFKSALTDSEIKHLKGIDQPDILGDCAKGGGSDDIRRHLPKVLAKIFSDMTPNDFCVEKITVKVMLKGSPFGVGLNGGVDVTFGRSG